MTTLGSYLSNTIAFVDMDEFEVQLYQKKDYPNYRGTPCVVADCNGRIVSVSYEAKSQFGISRSMRLEEALGKCNLLNVIEKPNLYDKPDARTSRHGSWAVLDVLEEFCSLGREVVLQYAPSDGFYIDCTQEVNARVKNEYINIAKNVHIEGSNLGTGKILKNRVDPHTFQLMCGAAYISELSDHLLEKTGIKCSAGISSNRLVAKMACPLHKPAGITILPWFNFNSATGKISLKEISGFGKEIGDFVKATLGIENLQQLRQWDLRDLEDVIGDSDMALKLYQGSRGICNEPVVRRGPNKSVKSSKSFHGDKCNMDIQSLLWNLKNRADEMEERLQEERERYKRFTTSLQIQIKFIDHNGFKMKRSNTFPISPEPNHITHKQIPQQALQIIQNFPELSFNTYEITKIILSAFKLETVAVGQKNLGTTGTQTTPTVTTESGNLVLEEEKEEYLSSKVYQLRISLDQVEPIWRVIQVAEDINFHKLHNTIQDAIGWKWYEPHEFHTGFVTHSGHLATIGFFLPSKSPDAIKFLFHEIETPMKDFLGDVGNEVIYYRGREKEWPHTVTVEKILPAVRGRDYPRCIDGKRAAPPEVLEPEDEKFLSPWRAINDPEGVKNPRVNEVFLNYDNDRFNPDDVFKTSKWLSRFRKT